MDTRLHLELDPEVGSSLEYKYRVNQLPQGDYSYVKWWSSGPILQGDPCKDESGNSRVGPKGATHVFPSFPICLVLLLSHIPVFGGLAVFFQRDLQHTGYDWLNPPTA